MSGIKAIEKLRASELVGQHMTIGEIADEIQAEVDSRFMELPVDADGVPIRSGEELYVKDTGEHVPDYCVYGVSRDYVFVWNGKRITAHFPYEYTHVKPRTLENVLGEFAYKVCDLNVEKREIAKYAAEIRELLCGDAE